MINKDELFKEIRMYSRKYNVLSLEHVTYTGKFKYEIIRGHKTKREIKTYKYTHFSDLLDMIETGVKNETFAKDMLAFYSDNSPRPIDPEDLKISEGCNFKKISEGCNFKKMRENLFVKNGLALRRTLLVQAAASFAIGKIDEAYEIMRDFKDAIRSDKDEPPPCKIHDVQLDVENIKDKTMMNYLKSENVYRINNVWFVAYNHNDKPRGLQYLSKHETRLEALVELKRLLTFRLGITLDCTQLYKRLDEIEVEISKCT